MEVQVIMTAAASEFIGPLTLSTLSKKPVLSDINAENQWNNHVALGLWADAMLVAPATAHTLAKMANGLCDNLLSAVFLSLRCPVFVAPAMDEDMWRHPATRANVEKLKSMGVVFIPIEAGELASGLIGEGRMAEPENILAFLDNHFSQNLPLKGKKALVTAGPTYEALDPVRFIGNHSTGKMGIAIAKALADQGALVQLVLGPSAQSADYPGVQVTRVMSAQEMYQACAGPFEFSDIVVLAAAVADYRPAHFSDKKIKKKDTEMSIELAKTIDIAATLGKNKQAWQCMVGFALETNDEQANALKKLEAKNLDMIVLNSLQDKGAGFGHDTNKISLFFRNGAEKKFELKSKTEAARDIVDAVVLHLNNA